ncbi:TetR/AcrR family transcriptional regulator [Curtobacterium pusillum]|uniref:TetR/AcrR family transcriptional regulator n=1 Tax=Curtobacterium pusillum TaxID=69373 RepID=UPI003828DB1B
MTTQATPRPRIRMAPEERREQILRAAWRLIAESGFNRVSLADVAAACDIRKSSVLHYFPSMTDLLFAVIALREEEDYEFYADGGPMTPGDRDSVRAAFTRVFQHNLERPELVRLYTVLSAEALAPDHPAHDYFASRAVLARGELASVLTWKASPSLAAAEFLSFWEGLQLTWRRGDEADAKAIWETFCERFFA